MKKTNIVSFLAVLAVAILSVGILSAPLSAYADGAGSFSVGSGYSYTPTYTAPKPTTSSFSVGSGYSYTPTYTPPKYTSTPSTNNYYNTYNSSNSSATANAYASAYSSSYGSGYSSGYQPYRSYYPTTQYYDTGCGYYYSSCGSGGGLNININKNNNTNNNTSPAPKCSDIGQTGIYPNCQPTVTRTCADTGEIGIYPNCHPRVTHTCADSGQVGSYPNCRNVDNNDDEPRCELDASDTRVEEGDRVVLSWDTENADYASINQGIGSVDEDGGSERVTVDEDTTFKMTVRNNSGSDTCSVTVRVDDNDLSSVVYSETPIQNPPTVYLSDLPYTGLEDITPSQMMYWLLLIAGIGSVGYFFLVKGKMLSFAKVSAGHVMKSEDEAVVLEDNAPEIETSREQEFIDALANGEKETAVDFLRTASVSGQGVEAFLAKAASVATEAGIATKLANALEASRLTGIRGAKEALLA